MINFENISGSGGSAIIEPRRIFTTLSRDQKFVRPSDVQADVLDQWFARRTSTNLTLKMNTGGGKTLVGLLLLQSSLNEKVRPAVYITPNRFLTAQVLAEAAALGIAATDTDDDPRFLRGDAILVANVYKVVNGGSHFGVGQKRIPLGAVVIDDAHACFSVIEEQFTMSFSSDHAAYKEVWNLFSDAFKEYDPYRHHDITLGDPAALAEIPFWMWQSHSTGVFQILKAHSATDDDVKFGLRLIERILPLCQCVISGKRIEFAPRCTPIDMIPSLAEAKRRIFMTATLANDGILVTHLGADASSVKTPIQPSTSDMGDRLIITPQEINRKFVESDLRDLARTVANDRNVVVLVPSAYRAESWRAVANQILDTKNMDQGVAALRQGHVGLTVLINRYDGIDLPYTACELLILDGLPRSAGLLRQRRNDVLDGSAGLVVEQVQRIEQGMGRGVRAADDRCVVMLFGSDLTKVVNFPDTFQRFTSGTRAQIELARRIADQIKSTSKAELLAAMAYSFNADPGWLRASKLAIASADEAGSSYVAEYAEVEREAFNLAAIGQYDRAAERLKAPADQEQDRYVKGYLKQQQAEYTNFYNKAEAQAILLTAVASNSSIIKPVAGIQHARIKGHNDQAIAATEFMSRFATPHQYIIWAMEVRDRLVFDPQGTDAFERALMEVGEALGFVSTRPDKENGKGPDNLWALGPTSFAVIECKSGAVGTEIVKADCNQLLGSTSWFDSLYAGADRTPVMIHKAAKFSNQASPSSDTRLMDEDRLAALKDAFRAFSEAVSTTECWRQSQKVGTQLMINKLTGTLIVDAYTRVPR